MVLELTTLLNMQWPMICGVPQGSILGPLLFLIYINDLLRSLDLLALLFADDTFMIYSDKDPKLLEVTVNQNLSNSTNWFIINKLTLNAKKTRAMLFLPKKNIISCPKFCISNTNI